MYARFLDGVYGDGGRINLISLSNDRKRESFSRCDFRAFVCCNMIADELSASKMVEWDSRRHIQENIFMFHEA